MVRDISREALNAKLAEITRPVLVEALPEKYYRHSHLPGAINIPHDQVVQLASRLIPNKATEIVVYCASATCQNSHLAAARLDELGYSDVSVYTAGKADWIEAGLPIEGSAARRAA